MMEDGHTRYREDLAAYLLDALDQHELREFRAHLEDCARCQADERWLRSAVEQLPSSVEQFEPSRELRNRLMARVHIEAQNDLTPTREEPPRRRWWTPLLRPAAALATVAVLAAGVAGYLIGQGGDEGPATSTIQAQATPEEPSARAAVVRTGDLAVLEVEQLPITQTGHVYQVWLQRGMQNPQPSSVFVVGRDGSGSVTVKGSLEGVDTVLVSKEPAGGSTAPTTQPVLTAKL